MRRSDVTRFGQQVPYPVFFDPSHRRWVAFIALATLSVFCLVFLMATLTIRIVNGPQVQGFSLSTPAERSVAGATYSVANNILETNESGVSADISAAGLSASVDEPGTPVLSNDTDIATTSNSDFFLTTDARQQR